VVHKPVEEDKTWMPTKNELNAYILRKAQLTQKYNTWEKLMSVNDSSINTLKKSLKTKENDIMIIKKNLFLTECIYNLCLKKIEKQQLDEADKEIKKTEEELERLKKERNEKILKRNSKKSSRRHSSPPGSKRNNYQEITNGVQEMTIDAQSLDSDVEAMLSPDQDPVDIEN
jgi:hypothetical protein